MLIWADRELAAVAAADEAARTEAAVFAADGDNLLVLPDIIRRASSSAKLLVLSRVLLE